MHISWRDIASTLTSVLSWFLAAQSTIPYSPSVCFVHSSFLAELVTCLDRFTVPRGYYDEVKYILAQPTLEQRAEWRNAVSSMLSVNGNCSSTVVPPSLQGLYMIRTFTEITTGSSYCVLVETNIQCGGYIKGWGAMVVPATRAFISRTIHISAPHPKYDIGTVEQAAALFKATGAHSLLIPGRSRLSFMEPSSCIAPSATGHIYYETDPAHNNLEPFFDANAAIYNWQHTHGGCTSSSCAFIQFHGKGESTCALDQVFLSSGLGSGPSSNKWYTDPSDRPIKRLKSNLASVFPHINISLPSDSRCPLTATKNVVGRFMNGVNPSQVCSSPSIPRHTTGEFIHVEQSWDARGKTSYDAWARALRETFEARCSVPGMVVDPISELCIFSSSGEGPSRAIRSGAASPSSRVLVEGMRPARSRVHILLSFLHLI